MITYRDRCYSVENALLPSRQHHIRIIKRASEPTLVKCLECETDLSTYNIDIEILEQYELAEVVWESSYDHFSKLFTVFP